MTQTLSWKWFTPVLISKIEIDGHWFVYFRGANIAYHVILCNIYVQINVVARESQKTLLITVSHTCSYG